MQNDIGELRVLITAQADKFNSEIAKVRGELAAMSEATSKISAKTFALGNVLGSVAKKAFGSLVGVVREAKNAYNETSASMTKLATVMQQRGATQDQYDAVIKTTEAEERLGVVSASVQQNGLQELATYVGKAESLQKLTNVMNNLIVQQHGYNATADHALQTATMMGKVLQGQTGGMERLGYHLDEADKALFQYGTEEERVTLLTGIVNDNLGNMNRRLGETNVGKQIQLANTWAQLKAQVGELATAVGNILIPAFSAVANVVGRAIAYVKAFFKLFGVETGNAASATASSVSDASDAVSDYGNAASGAAKKVKKSLAAFDEMNTITEQSNSGGGDGGGFDILGDLEASAAQIDWGSLIPDIKLPKWINEISNIFSDIDFKKVTKSFQRLGKDIQKAMKPVSQILKDVWQNYIKPFVTWSGNELLPAFFNTLGGAIQFVGAVIGTFWNAALKPFIDTFLVPIAKWTGGIIVNVLNGIGNALRGIAENQTAVNIIVALTSGVLAGIAAYEAYQIVMGVAMGIQLAMNGAMVAGTTANGAYAVGLGIVSAAQQAWAAVCALATGATTIFSAALQMIPFVAIGTAIAGVVGWLANMSSSTDTATTSSESLRGKMDETHQQIDTNKNGVIDYTEALDAMADAQLAASDATLARIRAEEHLADTTQKYQPIIDELKNVTDLTAEQQKKLEKAETEVENASIRLQVAQKKEAEEKKNNTDRTREATEAAIKARKYTVAQQLANNLASESFSTLEAAIKDVVDKNDTWTDSLGVTRQFTQSEIDELVTSVLASSQQIEDGVTYHIDRMTGAITATVVSLNGTATTAGHDFDSGLAYGISANSYLVLKASNALGEEAYAEFCRVMGIHSPSTVMKKAGAFMDRGLGLGISKNEKPVVKAMSAMAAKVTAAFSPLTNLSVSVPEINSPIIGIDDGKIELSEADRQPIMLALRIDGEDIPLSASRISGSLNAASMLSNGSVVVV